MLSQYKYIPLVVLSLCVLQACETVPSEYGYGDPVRPLTTEQRVQSAIRDAAIETNKGKIAAGALKAAETAYKQDPKNPSLALAYATNLRKAGVPEQAQLVLRPFAITPKLSTPEILVEYAKIKLEAGDFEGAQIYAQEAMVLNPDYAPSYHVLGVANDAQGYHQAAENHFRKALTLLAETDPLRAAVQNNLALSLLAQGKSLEAESVLSETSSNDALSEGTVRANQSFVNSL